MAERFCDVGRGITLCCETFGEQRDPAMLLVMGLGTQMIAWHDDFCELLAARGFYVARFDNRDCGRSTRIRARPPTFAQLVSRRIDPVAYTLADMADDADGLLSELDLKPAHIVGASMGGMIAQTLAARHPESVRSLTSIMSTTGHRRKGQPALGIYRYLVRRAPDEREAFIEYITRVTQAIGSPGVPVERIRDLAARSYDRGYHPAGTGRQLGAIVASGDRTAELGQIEAPTLVIHGRSDRMVSLSGGIATAEAIPGSRLLVLDEMGHDLPQALWSQLVDAIAEHAHAADRASAVV